MADTREVPFYDRDGEHWMTVEIELHDAGEPPELVQLADPEAGRGIQRQFRREHRPGSDSPWGAAKVSTEPAMSGSWDEGRRVSSKAGRVVVSVWLGVADSVRRVSLT